MDGFKELVFSTVSDFMGVEAIWEKEEGPVSGRVLFKDPSEPVAIGDTERYEYRPASASFEFYRGTFPGLKELVDEKIKQFVTLRGERYLVVEVSTLFDGDTYRAHIDPYM
jgi:hypothetical protein